MTTPHVEIIDLVVQKVEIIELVGGPSAYQVAVNNGFVGTEAEWLASLEAGGQDISGKLDIAAIDDVPIDAETSAPISSNWAFNHAAQQVTDLAAKLNKSGGTHAGLSEQQKTDHVVSGAAQTITLDYLEGCHTITCTAADAFTIAKGSNWPVTASGSQLFQVIASGVTVGAPTFSGWTTILVSPDFSGITTLTGSGLYVIREIAGKTYIRKVVEV